VEKLTVSGAGPDVGWAEAATAGGWLLEMNRIRRILLMPVWPVVSEKPRST